MSLFRTRISLVLAAFTRAACVCSLCAVLGLGFTGPSLAQQDTLTIGHQDNTASLDPAKAYETTSMGIIASLLYDQLIGFSGDDLTEPLPELAESWEVKEDGRTWIFHLRQGVTFPSGRPVNADAVVFSLQRVLKIGADPVWLISQFGLTEDTIVKIDEYTVQLVLDRQYASTLFLSCLAGGTASILDPEEVMAHEQDGDLGSAWLEEHSAGSGPFALETAIKQDTFVMQANKTYWKGEPAWEKVVMKHVPDAAEQMAMLEADELDIAWNLGPDEKLSLSGSSDFQVFEALWFKIYHIGMNLDYGPFAKPEVRDAVRYAIDYTGLVEYTLQGAAETLQTFIPPGLLGYTPEQPYAYEPETARRLLAEAGYPDGFEAELICFNFSPWVDVALHVKRDLARVGIQLKVTPMPPSQLSPAVNDRKTQMFLFGWLFDYPDTDANAKSFAHCDSLGEDASIKLRAWQTNYLIPEMSVLVDRAAQESDTEKRDALYRQVAERIVDDGPFAFLFVPIRYYGIRTELTEFIDVPRFMVQDSPVLKLRNELQ